MNATFIEHNFNIAVNIEVPKVGHWGQAISVVCRAGSNIYFK